MYDYINILLLHFDFSLWANDPRLKFGYKTFGEKDEKGNIIKKTSEIAEYKGLQLVHTETGRCYIKGSIHRFYNQGGDNSSRFTFLNFLEAIEVLEKEFGVIPSKAKFSSAEFGLNLVLKEKGLTAKKLYKSIKYKIGTAEKYMCNKKKKAIGRLFVTEDSTLKVYDKTEQADVESCFDIFRYELRFNRTRSLKRLGITYLSDAMDLNKVIDLFDNKILKSVDDTIYYAWDSLPNTNKLPEYQKKQFLNWRNAEYWEKMSNPKKRNRHKIRFEKQLSKYAKYDIKKMLKDLLVKEFETVVCMDYETIQAIIKQRKQQRQPNHNKEDTQIKMGINAERIVCGKRADCKADTITINYCQTCGKDISHQKKGSKFCNDQRICRDKAYNLKISEHRKKEKDKINQDIKDLIEQRCNGSYIIITEPTTKKKKLQKNKGEDLGNEIVVSVGGKQYSYSDANARFFLREFYKSVDNELIIQY